SAWARQPVTQCRSGTLGRRIRCPPVFMMTYNPAYYCQLLEKAGFRKAKDLFAYRIEPSAGPLERLQRLARRTRRRLTDLRVRPITRGSLAADLPNVREVYNAAWQGNWGFVPMTPEDMAFIARRLKPLLDRDFSSLA